MTSHTMPHDAVSRGLTGREVSPLSCNPSAYGATNAAEKARQPGLLGAIR